VYIPWRKELFSEFVACCEWIATILEHRRHGDLSFQRNTTITTSFQTDKQAQDKTEQTTQYTEDTAYGSTEIQMEAILKGEPH